MIERRTLAWIVAGAVAIAVMALILQRSEPVGVVDSHYPALEKVMRIATAVTAGTLMGLVAFLLLSRNGG